MKKTFALGNGRFGEGSPKVCVPIVGSSREEIWRLAGKAAESPADLAEWRADFYEDVFSPEEFLTTLKGVKKRLGEKPLLFTFRTKGEGGVREAGAEAYTDLNERAAASGCVELLDLEVFFQEEKSRAAIETLKRTGVRVIASNHDFQKTPPTEEMLRRLLRMEELGADAAKLAVMPKTPQDVLTLLGTTLEARERLRIPVVTMSMGSLGVLSRLSGSFTGSAMTFAALGRASAPGQLTLEQVCGIFKLLEE